MGDQTQLSIIINAVDNASRTLESVGQKASGLGQSFKDAALLSGAAWAAIGGGVAVALNEYSKQEDATARLSAGLKNIGENSDKFKNSLIQQADALERTTRFSNEEIISAQAMLTTFRLHTDQIQTLTPHILDMAEALRNTSGGTLDLEHASILLGKAIGGEDVQGLAGALRRFGVVMTKHQEDLLKTGTVQQKVADISEILDRNFKGFAESGAATLSGRLAITTHQFEDLLKIGGEYLSNFLGPYFDKLTKIIEVLQDVITGHAKLTDLFKVLHNELGKVGDILSVVIKFFATHKDATIALAGAIAGFLTISILGLTIAIVSFIGVSLPIIGIFAVIGAAIALAVTHWNEITNAVNTFIQTANNMINLVTSSISNFVNYVSTHWTQLWTETIPKILGSAIGTILADLVKLLFGAVILFVDLPGKIATTLWNNRQVILDTAGKIMKAFFDVFTQGMALVIKAFTDLPGKIGDALKNGFKAAGNFLGSATDSFRKTLGFAQGGFVPGTPGEPQLVIAHGGERILSPTEQDGVGKNSVQGITINMNGSFKLDSEERIEQLAQTISKLIGKQNELASRGLF